MSANFSAVAEAYAGCRPSYPDELFAYLSELCDGHRLAWDCGAGNGQASLPLTRTFRHVVATDTSRAMLSRASRRSGIYCCVTAAECAALRASCADLVVVAQALHWFDVDRFYGEVRRVLVPGGVLAVWTYGLGKLEQDQADALLGRFYHDVVGPYWLPGRRHVESGYQTLPFPFPELAAPAFYLEKRWTAAELLGYVGTWSATQRYREVVRRDPLDTIAGELTRLWGRGARLVRWPVSMRVGRKPA